MGTTTQGSRWAEGWFLQPPQSAGQSAVVFIGKFSGQGTDFLLGLLFAGTVWVAIVFYQGASKLLRKKKVYRQSFFFHLLEFTSLVVTGCLLLAEQGSSSLVPLPVTCDWSL